MVVLTAVVANERRSKTSDLQPPRVASVSYWLYLLMRAMHRSLPEDLVAL